MYKKVNKLNITENHLRVLCLFTKGFERKYYIREVQKMLDISPRTAQTTLDKLEKKGILESKIRGKIREYKLKKNYISKEYLILTEIYKKISFLEKNQMIKEILFKIDKHIQGIALIFGSYAKGTQKKHSDLDIFIVGNYNKKEIDKFSEMYGIGINIKKYPLDIFKKNIGNDILITEVLKNHIAVVGVEDFIKIVI